MKILKGEEARKTIEEIVKEKALSDEEMEGVTGGYTIDLDVQSISGHRYQAAYISKEEYKWLQNTHAGKSLLERLEKKKGCFVNAPAQWDAGRVYITDDPEGFDFMIACFKDMGFPKYEDRWDNI